MKLWGIWAYHDMQYYKTSCSYDSVSLYNVQSVVTCTELWGVQAVVYIVW